ncbi:type II toxin-antitoxin system YafO family toxin [Enterobacter kobei]|uniref:type II toxin-antitoxin system YafO family toxin n=1 Tax=Enterobacter kobei TaxID=208224 RepID=UPI0021BF04D7|nr:type II toxin-antitoxin system YafO family toxin [Enterobacter kobei]UXJ66696.1 type II toxin-antitoxin system YafO family toxin [Enterobacter kobei]
MGFKIVRSPLIAEAIAEAPIAEHPISEFEEYKRICIEEGDIPAPSETDQRTYESYLETIGRDRFMTSPIEARAEELHHAHVWQERCCWEDDDEEDGMKVQWACTSDSYVVYSYFIDADDDHHFYIIDYCNDGAHGLISDRTQVLDWANQAERYRLRNV